MDKENNKTSPEEDEYNQRIEDLRAVVNMSNGAGRRFIRNIIADAQIYKSGYKGNAETNFILGQKEAAFKIILDLQIAATKSQRADILL